MLTKNDNDLLCSTNAGTPMGELFRRFWLPALVPSELPAPDSDPIRFRILGEDLIAFRDSNGQVGFLAQHCPHRGASLFFGRNEEAGLRCVYHGWKFDTSGRCIDMPNEPAESDFRTRVKAVAYPAAEYAGLIWIYMGPPDSSRRCRSISGALARMPTRPRLTSGCRNPTAPRPWKATSIRRMLGFCTRRLTILRFEPAAASRVPSR
jgi:phenylpropionate dioxygenase-like ring-hydroxylating dioxygenase large terminal subunit